MTAFDWDQLAQRVNEVHRAVEAHSLDKAAEAIPLVMNAWYHAGAANVALELITNIEDPDRRRGLAALFTAPPDLLDWAAFRLGARSAMSTLDLCAAAAWHLSDGQPLKGDKKPTLSSAFHLRELLTPGPLRDWLVSAHESAEYSPIQTFRHGFTHRLVARHLKIRLGEPTPLEIESQVGNFRQTAIAHLPMAAPFALQQFSAFCGAAIEQFKRWQVAPRLEKRLPALCRRCDRAHRRRRASARARRLRSAACHSGAITASSSARSTAAMATRPGS